MTKFFKKSMISIVVITLTIAVTTFCSFAAAEKTIKVLSAGGPEIDHLIANMEKFEKLSGIKVVHDIVPRSILNQRLMAELIELKGNYDVVFNEGGTTWTTYVQKGEFIPIEDYLDKGVVEQLYARKGFTDPRTGKVAGIPQYHNFNMLFYRKDLFNDPKEKSAFKEKYGRELTVPTTLDELVDVAEFFHRPPEMYGYCIQGMSHGSFVYRFIEFLLGMGENVGDEDGNLTLNTPGAIKSLETVVKLAKFFPPGWEAMNQFDVNELMLQGKIPIYSCFSYIWKDYIEKMPDKVGIAAPVGDVQSGLSISGFLALIPKNASNPEGAVEFLKWLSSYDYQKSFMLSVLGNFATRSDVLEDPEVSEKIIGIDIIKNAVAKANGGKIPNATWMPEMYEGLYNVFFDVFKGKKTAEEGLNWLQNVKFAGRRAIE